MSQPPTDTDPLAIVSPIDSPWVPAAILILAIASLILTYAYMLKRTR